MLSVPGLLLVTLLPLQCAFPAEAVPAAMVNKTAISQAQVDAAIAGTGKASEADRQAALERLISQELMAQQAAREQLAQAPEVVAAIEAATRQILSQAYLANRGKEVANPGEELVRAYYDRNPALFSERAVYELQEIGIQATGAKLDAVIEHYKQIETLDQMVDWLRKNSFEYSSDVAIKAAEDLPGDLLAPVSKLQPGQVIRVTTDRGISIVQLIGKRPEPVTFSAAKPVIETAIKNQALGDLISQDLSKLRTAADIEYFPPYKR